MSPDTPPRLGAIAAWLQQADEAILYRPDGLAADAESPPAAQGRTVALTITVGTRRYIDGLASARQALQALGEAMGR